MSRHRDIQRYVLKQIHARCYEYEEECDQGRVPLVSDYLDGFSGEAALRLIEHLVEIEKELIDRAELERRQEIYQSAASMSPRLGRFADVGRTLGGGGFGIVMESVDTEVSRLVAVKRLAKNIQLQPPSRREYFERLLAREAEITGRLSHRGIPAVYGIHPTPADSVASDIPPATNDPSSSPFFAMELIQGKSFGEYVETIRQSHQGGGLISDRNVSSGLGERPWFTEFRSKPIVGLLRKFVDVCDTVQYAHDKYVLHRDIKLDNILVGDYQEVFVIDWGFAWITDEDRGFSTNRVFVGESVPDNYARSERTAVGGLGFISPEQFDLDSALDRPADVFSLGGVLYYLLTGRRPFFQVRSYREYLRAAVGGDYIPPRQLNRTIPRPLEAICCRALSADPEVRYPSAEALANDVQAWLAGDAVSVYHESPIESTIRWSRKHMALTIATSVFLLLLSIGSFISMYALQSQRTKADSEAVRAREFANTLKDLVRFPDAPMNFDTLRLRAQRSSDDQSGIDEFLAEGLRRAGELKQHSPAVSVELQGTIGSVYLARGQFVDAYSILQTAHEDAMSLSLPNRARHLAEIKHSFGCANYVAGNADQAESLLREAVQLRSQVLSPDASETLVSKYWLALAITTFSNERVDEAIALLRDVVEVQKQVVSRLVKQAASESMIQEETRGLGMAQLGLAAAYIQNQDGALTTLKSATRNLRGSEIGRIVADFLVVQGQPEEMVVGKSSPSDIESKFRNIETAVKRFMGNRHPILGWVDYEYASFLDDQGRIEEASVRIRNAGTRLLDQLDHDHPQLIKLRLLEADLDRQMGKSNDAIVDLARLVKSSEKLVRQKGPSFSYLLARCRGEYAYALRSAGRYVDALHEAKLAIDSRTFSHSPLLLAEMHVLQAECHLEMAHPERTLEQLTPTHRPEGSLFEHIDPLEKVEINLLICEAHLQRNDWSRFAEELDGIRPLIQAPSKYDPTLPWARRVVQRFELFERLNPGSAVAPSVPEISTQTDLLATPTRAVLVGADKSTAD